MGHNNLKPHFETLEPRLLFAADVTGTFAPIPPGGAFPGEDGSTIGLVVRNTGDESAPLGLIVDLFAVRPGEAFDRETAVPLLSTPLPSAIAPGEELRVDLLTQLPPAEFPGSYRVVAVIDATDRVSEPNEGNNTVTSGVVTLTQPRYDLSALVSEVGMPPAVLSGRESRGTITVGVTNNSVSASPLPNPINLDVQVFLRPQGVGNDSRDVLVGEATVPAGGLTPGFTALAEVELVIPETLAPGTYGYFVRVDSSGDLAETNETNNNTLLGNALTVAEPFVTLGVTLGARSSIPDVPILAAAPGFKPRLALDLTNLGNLPTSRRGFVPVQVVARRVDTGEIVPVGTFTVRPGRIAPGATRTVMIRPALPGLEEGEYVLRVTVGSSSNGGTPQTFETDEEAPLEVAAPVVDLAIESASTTLGVNAPSLTGGLGFARVRNTGNVAINGRYTVEFLATPSGVLDGTEVSVGRVEGVRLALAPGQTSKGMRVRLVAPEVSQDTGFTVIARVRPARGETELGNNVMLVPGEVLVTPVNGVLGRIGTTLTIISETGPTDQPEGRVQTGRYIDSRGQEGTYKYTIFYTALDQVPQAALELTPEGGTGEEPVEGGIITLVGDDAGLPLVIGTRLRFGGTGGNFNFTSNTIPESAARGRAFRIDPVVT